MGAMRPTSFHVNVVLVLVPASVDLFTIVLWTAWGVWDAALLAVVLSRSSRRLDPVLLGEPLERLEKVLADMT